MGRVYLGAGDNINDLKGYSSIFPLTENPISEGSKWKNGLTDGIDWNDVQTNAGLAYGTVLQPNTGGTVQYADSLCIRKDIWRLNLTITGTIYNSNPNGNGGYEVELWMLSTLSSNKLNGYELNMNTRAATGFYWGLVRHDGARSNFTVLTSGTSSGGNGAGGSPATGDIVKMVYLNGLFSIYLNSTLQGSVTDTTYQSGSPGFGFDPYTVSGLGPNLNDAGFNKVLIYEN